MGFYAETIRKQSVLSIRRTQSQLTMLKLPSNRLISPVSVRPCAVRLAWSQGEGLRFVQVCCVLYSRYAFPNDSASVAAERVWLGSGLKMGLLPSL
jgi:hypothetical protein